MNQRFALSLWDNDGFVQAGVLADVSSVRVEEECNQISQISFRLSLADQLAKYVEVNRIIRLHDKSLGVSTARIVGIEAGTRTISLTNADDLEIGKTIQVDETPINSFAASPTSNVSSSEIAIIPLASVSGLSAGDILLVQDESHFYTIEVDSVLTSSIVCILPYDITTSAVLSKPGRSFVARILSLRNQVATTTASVSSSSSPVGVTVDSLIGMEPGDYVTISDSSSSETAYIQSIDIPTSTVTFSSLIFSYASGATIENYSATLSRMDFEPTTLCVTRVANFRSFRIEEVSWSRENDVPKLEIACSGIEKDLSRTLYLKNKRNTYSNLDVATESKEQVLSSLSEIYDDLFFPYLDENDDPGDTSSFISGFILFSEYATGTAGVTYNSTSVSFSGARFSSEDYIHVGSTISFEGVKSTYTVLRVDSGNSLTLTTAYTGPTASGLRYRIFNRGYPDFSDDEIQSAGNVSNGSDTIVLTNSLTDEKVTGGTWVKIAGDKHIYTVDLVTSSSTVVLTEPVERTSASNISIIFFQNRKQFEIADRGMTVLSMLESLISTWSDSEQYFWFRVNEDRSIDILRKPYVDSRDPTAKLAIRRSRNLTGLTRRIEYRDYGNVIIPYGSRDNWRRLQYSGVNADILDAGSAGSFDRVFLSQYDNANFRIGDTVLVYNPAETLQTTSFSLYTATDSSLSMVSNQYKGALAIATSGDGRGQIRWLSSNSTVSIIVSKPWDILPDSTLFHIIARNSDFGVGNVDGFGVRRNQIVTGYTSSSITINISNATIKPWVDFVRGSYRHGVLSLVSTSSGVEERYRISDAVLSGTALTISFEGTSPSVLTGYLANITAPHQVIEQYDSGTTFTLSSVTVSPTTLGYPDWSVDLWNGARLYLVSGTYKMTSYFTVLDTVDVGSGNWRLDISSTFPGLPTNGDKILLVKQHTLDMVLNSSLGFIPSSNSHILQLYQPDTLTIGKAWKNRAIISGATDDTLGLLTGESSKFDVGDVIFVGCADMDDPVHMFGLERGNLMNGQVATISAISSNYVTISTKFDPIPAPGDPVEKLSVQDRLDIHKHQRQELVLELDEMDSPYELERMADKHLFESTTIIPQYTLSVLDLNQVDKEEFEQADIQLGDTLRVIDEEMNIDVSNLKVIGKSWSVDNPADVTLKLSALVPSQIDSLVDMNTRLRQLEARSK